MLLMVVFLECKVELLLYCLNKTVAYIARDFHQEEYLLCVDINRLVLLLGAKFCIENLLF